MNLIEQFGEYNLTAKKGRDIKYIVIHYTAGVTSKSGTAKSSAKYFNKEATKASADFIVDDEFVVQYNPDIKNKYTWHCGGSKYKTQGGSLYKICTSANSIGIEICSTNDTKKVTQPNDSHWSFSDAVIKNAVELTKQLMQEYNIDTDHIIRHYDVNGKPCPGIIGWNKDTNDESKWEAFKMQLIPVEAVKVEEVKPDVTTVEEPKTEEKVVTLGDVMQAIEASDEVPASEIEKPVETKVETKQVQTKNSGGFLSMLISIITALFK